MGLRGHLPIFRIYRWRRIIGFLALLKLLMMHH